MLCVFYENESLLDIDFKMLWMENIFFEADIKQIGSPGRNLNLGFAFKLIQVSLKGIRYLNEKGSHHCYLCLGFYGYGLLLGTVGFLL
jgi:hypothetical protein